MEATKQSITLDQNVESEPMNHPSWGEFIMYHKRCLRLTTSQFASKLGVGRESIYYWLRAKKCQPQQRIRTRVEEILGQKWEDFNGPSDIYQENEEPFCIVLRELLDDSGLHYKDIAQKSGLASANIYNWAAGLCYPTLVSLCLIVEVITPRLTIPKGRVYEKLHDALLRSL